MNERKATIKKNDRKQLILSLQARVNELLNEYVEGLDRNGWEAIIGGVSWEVDSQLSKYVKTIN